MEIKKNSQYISLSGFGEINLDLTLNCGQAFRWQRLESGLWSGVSGAKYCVVEKADNELRFYDTELKDVRDYWVNYFDLNTDYGKILATLKCDPPVAAAIQKYGTVHILRQDPWEALCSFIISACNNIPRITSIVECLCKSFGEKLPGGRYSFPQPGDLYGLTADDLAVLHAGYRDKYIIDAANKVYSGEVDFDIIRGLNYEEAKKNLMTVCGVGKKVADCTLLFSLGFTDAFPSDRHIERAVKLFYPDGLPKCFTPNSGLAQQYIFHAMRMGEQGCFVNEL